MGPLVSTMRRGRPHPALPARPSWAGPLSLRLLILVLAGLAGCVPRELPPPDPMTQPVEMRAGRDLTAVLAAGSDPAFYNAIDHLHDLLVLAGVAPEQVHRFNGRGSGQGLADLLGRIAAMRPPPGGSCLVYLAAHGAFGSGIAIGGAILTPDALDHALAAGCGPAPTVIVVSACYGGQFAEAPLPNPRRIILTAARADRTSFGCQASLTYTFFDECLLGAAPESGDWRSLADRVVGCVATRETLVGAPPSEPQFRFGAAIAGLESPWPRPIGGPTIHFLPASDVRYEPRLVPMDADAREAQATVIQGYASALSPKALALTPFGLAIEVTPDRQHRRTADDVTRLALERCEWLSGGACLLFARDERVSQTLPSGLYPFHPPYLTRSGPLTPATTPFIREDERPMIAAYLDHPGPKALAISPGRSVIATGEGETPTQARAIAIARCATIARDCVLVAEDDQLVLGWRRP